jgi:eukaryotic-like serine/threonine-protein kinase
MIGTRMGNWLLTSEIGRSTLGTVYRATNTSPKSVSDPTHAAVKVLLDPMTREANFQSRFPAEMLALQRLTHPNIVRFYDSGIQAGLAYFATEWVDGTDCRSLLAQTEKTREQPGLNWQQTFFRIAIQVTRAMKHGHHRSVLHRELKPSTILLLADGTVKVTDFGIAKFLHQSPLSLSTEPMSTACYLAPEYFTGKPLTRRSDLYALGGVLYTLLTGRPPFVAANAAEMMHKHCYSLPDRPANFVPKLPPELDEFICSLLAKDPTRRPASAGNILEELDQLRGRLERKGHAILLPPSTEDPTGTHPAMPSESEVSAKAVEPDAPRVWPRAVMLSTALLLVVGTILFVFFRPRPAAEDLWSAAQPLVQSESPEDWDKAREEFLGPLSEWYPNWKTSEVRQAKQLLADRKELLRSFSIIGKTKYSSEAERIYYRGMKLAQVSDFASARRTWETLIQVFAKSEAESRWVGLSKLGLSELDRRAASREAPHISPEVLERLKQLRETGHGAEANLLAKALEDLYRDQPDVLEMVRTTPPK